MQWTKHQSVGLSHVDGDTLRYLLEAYCTINNTHHKGCFMQGDVKLDSPGISHRGGASKHEGTWVNMARWGGGNQQGEPLTGGTLQ